MAPVGGIARQPRGFGVLLVLAALAPAVVVVYAMLSDLFMGSNWLGADPVKSGEHLLGEWTLRLLFGTLLITPLRRVTGWNWLAKHRRTLGLFAFAYVSLHLLTWTLLDVQIGISEYVGWADIKKDILKRPFITIGMLAFLLMVPLAVTSTKKMIARLGKNWRKLHRLVYVIPVLGVVHYWMAVKLDITEPAIYALFLAGLLYWRARQARITRAAATVPSPAETVAA
ncbi:MAG: sulfoxide reductase heme-binding subunit YedZ [Gemmatimonadota bacterium]|nr:sulfoxide reductase heme-binding subunit YedZ [Gemmatimonadota bacterium]